ncbi:MAG: TetR/AcrR family transcriptional regulator [Pseudomonadota bacterium]
MTAATQAQRAYHHGDLHSALIVAAAELIEESGSMNFSMADAARKAGVSTAAPYRHFRDKEDLLDWVSRLAFYGLGEGARQAVARTPDGSIERITALGNHYLNYVSSKPAFYDLMWGDIAIRAFNQDDFDRNASGFYILLDAVQSYLDSEGLTSEPALDIAVQLWSSVHGMSAIRMSGKLPHFHPQADTEKMLERATRTFMAGIKAKYA